MERVVECTLNKQAVILLNKINWLKIKDKWLVRKFSGPLGAGYFFTSLSISSFSTMITLGEMCVF
jgi:hypothetical protein